jgi:IclR family acetate operon transcriptional repressor
MRRKGFLTYLQSERVWSLGPAALTIGDVGQRRELLSRLARPILTRLAHTTGEAAIAGVLSGSDMECVARALPARSTMNLLIDTGVSLPAHLHAVGRAMLANGDPRQARALYPPGRRLANLTGKGEPNVVELHRALGADRARGYSEESGLAFRDQSSIAVPVFDRQGCTAAVGIAFMTRHRFGTYRAELVEPVRAAADELTACLGGSP